MFWNIGRIYFFFFRYKLLRAIILFFFFKFVQSSFSYGKFIFYQLYLFIKGLFFVISSECCPIYSRYLIILITLSVLSFIVISILSLFEYITCSSLLCMEEINLFDFVSWNFQVSSLFRLFMISFKYVLTLLRYYSTGSASFWSSLLSYST